MPPHRPTNHRRTFTAFAAGFVLGTASMASQVAGLLIAVVLAGWLIFSPRR